MKHAKKNEFHISLSKRCYKKHFIKFSAVSQKAGHNDIIAIIITTKRAEEVC
jgi:hypothetical protein